MALPAASLRVWSITEPVGRGSLESSSGKSTAEPAFAQLGSVPPTVPFDSETPQAESASTTRSNGAGLNTGPILSIRLGKCYFTVTSFEALLLLSFDSGTVFAGSAVTVNVWFPFWPFELHP